MRPESPNIDDYLESTDVIDVGDESIESASHQIIGETDSDVEKAERLFHWVRDEIPHTNDVGGSVVTCPGPRAAYFGDVRGGR